MPEIIEVKSYSDFIYKHTINDLLLNIKIKKGRYKNHGPFTLYKQLNKLLPLKIVNINSKGKFMYMTLENNYNIGITLGLMGGWFYKKNDSTKMIHGLSKSQYFLVEQYISKALKHLNIYFIFKLGILFFFDQLSFGTITIFTNKEELDEKLRSIGPDVLDINTTFDIFKEKIRQHKNYEKYIGNILVNQKILSGIGNYIRSDVLWLSMISPFRKIKNITINELYTIYYNIRSYIWDATSSMKVDISV